jgi:hypothetical protein
MDSSYGLTMMVWTIHSIDIGAEMGLRSFTGADVTTTLDIDGTTDTISWSREPSEKITLQCFELHRAAISGRGTQM